MPTRAMVSAKLMPAALTEIRTSPRPTGGSGSSRTSSTSGGPYLGITTARIALTLLRRARPARLVRAARSEVDGAARVKAVELEDLLEELVWHRRIGRQRQDRVLTGGLRSDGGGADVHAVGAEDRPDAADHARLVLVAEDHEVLGERHVEALAPDPHEVGQAPRADGGPGDLDRLVSRLDPHRDQLGELVRDRVLELREVDAPLLGQRRGVDEVHLLLGVAGEDSHEHRDAEQAGVVLGYAPPELRGDPIDGPVAEPLRQPTEPLAERHEGREGLHLLRPDGGDV